MMSSTPTNPEESQARAALRVARRVCIKAGTSVVANDDGSPSLTRLGAIVEQIAELNHAGIEVIFISSGAVGMGKNLLRKQARLNMSFKDLHNSKSPALSDATPHRGSTSIGDLHTVDENMETSATKSYAAAGQFELMNLYQSLLSPKGVTASQMLLTQADFADEHHLQNLSYAIERQLTLGIVPIINENDAVSITATDDDGTPHFTDNDSLAALCARSFGAEVLLLLTDVEGVYDMPPSNPKARLIPYYHTNSNCAIGEKSSQGRGGMSAKIGAARSAVQPGSKCAACVIADGSDLDSIRSVLYPHYKNKSEPAKGTLFTTPGSDLEKLCLEELVMAVEVSIYGHA